MIKRILLTLALLVIIGCGTPDPVGLTDEQALISSDACGVSYTAFNFINPPKTCTLNTNWTCNSWISTSKFCASIAPIYPLPGTRWCPTGAFDPNMVVVWHGNGSNKSNVNCIEIPQYTFIGVSSDAYIMNRYGWDFQGSHFGMADSNIYSMQIGQNTGVNMYSAEMFGGLVKIVSTDSVTYNFGPFGVSGAFGTNRISSLYTYYSSTYIAP